eukprot:TRINITY_DN10920_c0_g1_i1.p1 TRINITY_DN10920_c0_g1~~TRINITY_DN10920_c0_g1_i1.p1  ORF type:complete len:535 (+),score=158.65 TRINITY_DN10920_c0_g1_i1:422-2026(+)
MGQVFNYSKTFVDRPTCTSVADVLQALEALGPNATTEQLRSFVLHHFWKAGHEVHKVQPADWQPQPAFLTNISDPLYREFAESVHGKWQSLVRRFNFTGLCENCSSAIRVGEHAFVVPGGRFREFYYWDTYWALEGLYVSEMWATAREVLLGLLQMVSSFGFVPNGARIYYLNRSQPPMLIQMVRRYVEASGDTAFLDAHISTLLSELEWWEAHRRVSLPGGAGLSRYAVRSAAPRPESYWEDSMIAESLPTQAARETFWSEIAGAAESGWDFSSRWLQDDTELVTIHTSDIVPADLNAILLRNEDTMSEWLAERGDAAGAKRLADRASRRRAAMRTFLWNGTDAQWHDWDLAQQRQLTGYYASNFVPLWGGQRVGPSATATVGALAERLEEGGFATSTVDSGEQWDSTNAWPPLQHFMAAGLLKTGLPSGATQARFLADAWVASNYCGWKVTGRGHMFEKYDSEWPGAAGGGGEYEVQAGFGWTNGVVLWMLKQYGAVLKAPKYCSSAERRRARATESRTERLRRHARRGARP